VQADEGLQAINGSEISQIGPAALSSPDVLPEGTDSAAISHTALQVQADRSCSECDGSLPAPTQAVRRSPVRPDAPKLRHNRLGKRG
jgi:hypothetical protein